MKLRGFLLAMVLCTLCTGQARALEYSVDAPEDYLFGRPTSEDTIYEQEPSQESKRNPAKRLRLEAEEQGSEWSSRPWAGTEWSGLCDDVDRSKNTALVAPGFGTPTSYLPGSGEALTPNLIPGALEGGGLVSSVGSVNYPTVSTPVDTDNAFTWSSTKFTDVTEDLYYSGGHLGTLKIPSIGLTVKVYQGTDSTQLAKGAGHFASTSIWDGNVCIAGHNRGVNNHFGKIHTLEEGDTITLATRLGTRTYEVTGVYKVSETDSSMLAASSQNQITLITCVRDQRDYRWCVQAVER